jgi:predicted DNA-binding transcriptional regulator AlpA
MRLTFTERTIQRVRARANEPVPLFSKEARELIGVSDQVWGRIAKMPQFPKMPRRGLRWLIDGHRLADFLEFWNRLEACLRIADVARLCHTSTAKIREMLLRKEFPEPFAVVHGSPRWERHIIEAWLHERYGDVQLDEPAVIRQSA